jgi:hypothetical protein
MRLKMPLTNENFLDILFFHPMCDSFRKNAIGALIDDGYLPILESYVREMCNITLKSVLENKGANSNSIFNTIVKSTSLLDDGYSNIVKPAYNGKFSYVFVDYSSSITSITEERIVPNIFYEMREKLATKKYDLNTLKNLEDITLLQDSSQGISHDSDFELFNKVIQNSQGVIDLLNKFGISEDMGEHDNIYGLYLTYDADKTTEISQIIEMIAKAGSGTMPSLDGQELFKWTSGYSDFINGIVEENFSTSLEEKITEVETHLNSLSRLSPISVSDNNVHIAGGGSLVSDKGSSEPVISGDGGGSLVSDKGSSEPVISGDGGGSVDSYVESSEPVISGDGGGSIVLDSDEDDKNYDILFDVMKWLLISLLILGGGCLLYLYAHINIVDTICITASAFFPTILIDMESQVSKKLPNIPLDLGVDNGEVAVQKGANLAEVPLITMKGISCQHERFRLILNSNQKVRVYLQSCL